MGGTNRVTLGVHWSALAGEGCPVIFLIKLNRGYMEQASRFSGKVVVITGAGSGIGEGTALRFAREGASVVLAGRRKEKLDAVAARLDDARTLVQVTDVADEAQATGLIDATVDRFGRIDVLVNNAGVLVMGKIADVSAADWRKVMSVNVDGVFFCTRAAMPHLVTSRGSVVNTSSVSGLGGDWGMTVYNAAKGAVSNLTRALAMDYGRDGVRVNAVCPSLTNSEMTADMHDNDALIAKFVERIPLGRAAEPDDIAAVIAFLASDDARFVTGVNLPVDGGLSASNGQPRVG